MKPFSEMSIAELLVERDAVAAALEFKRKQAAERAKSETNREEETTKIKLA